MPTRDEVFEALRQVEDPELGMDIVDLGLLYDAEIEGSKVKVIHSLTSMGCPAGPMIQDDIRSVVSSLPDVDDVEIELTSPHRRAVDRQLLPPDAVERRGRVRAGRRAADDDATAGADDL